MYERKEANQCLQALDTFNYCLGFERYRQVNALIPSLEYCVEQRYLTFTEKNKRKQITKNDVVNDIRRLDDIARSCRLLFFHRINIFRVDSSLSNLAKVEAARLSNQPELHFVQQDAADLPNQQLSRGLNP